METAFLGVDTSNYTTSVALVAEDKTILLNAKRLLPVKEGEVGLRQQNALFEHTKNLPELFEENRELFSRFRIAAIGVSARPRDVEGSYMPCFLAGVSAASAAAPAPSVSRSVEAPVNITVNASGTDSQALGQSIYNSAQRYLVKTLRQTMQ